MPEEKSNRSKISGQHRSESAVKTGPHKSQRAKAVSGEERLQKYLAACGVASRREAEKLILAGLVKVNGRKVTELGSKINPEHDRVQVGSKLLVQEKPRLYLFHKPAKVVSTMRDPEGRKCIADFVSGLAERVYPVGRLDFDVTGLLLLTNQGQLAHSLLHPSFGVEREYLAKVRNRLSESARARLLKGVILEDGKAKVLSVSEVEAGDGRSSLLRLTVAEGRKHFVKRVLSAVGLPVLQLKRLRYGDYKLGNLKPGELKEVPLRHP